jgi:hypothetical protein
VLDCPPILKPLFLVIVGSRWLLCKRICNHLRKWHMEHCSLACREEGSLMQMDFQEKGRFFS